MKFTVLIAMTALLSSCGIFQVETLERPEFVMQGYKGDATAEQIRLSLTKSQNTGGGFLSAQVLPLTDAYLSAQRSTRASSRGLSPEAIAQMKTQDFERYLRDKNCFQIDAQIVRHQEAMDLSQWEIYLVDQEKISHALEWQSFSQTIEGRFASAQGELAKWAVGGIACSQDDHDLQNGFSLRVTPSFVPWPFPKTMVFEWIFTKSSQERKEKRRSYRRYRGY